MNIVNIAATIFVFALTFASSAMPANKAHWVYFGEEGPAHWCELDDAYTSCSLGEIPSPINLTAMAECDLPEMKINYKIGGNNILNNGHTIQVNYAPGSTISVADHEFELKQFHFHSPSENTIEAYSYPMEAHFVHADKNGNLAVIAVMFKLGDNNTGLEIAWAQMPEQAGETHELSPIVDANMLLPHGHDYYRFNGSLTTPPCSEGVSWFVMKPYNTASKVQLEKFSHVMHYPNNRPIQPINSRVLVQ